MCIRDSALAIPSPLPIETEGIEIVATQDSPYNTLFVIDYPYAGERRLQFNDRCESGLTPCRGAAYRGARLPSPVRDEPAPQSGYALRTTPRPARLDRQAGFHQRKHVFVCFALLLCKQRQELYQSRRLLKNQCYNV